MRVLLRNCVICTKNLCRWQSSGTLKNSQKCSILCADGSLPGPARILKSFAHKFSKAPLCLYRRRRRRRRIQILESTLVSLSSEITLALTFKNVYSGART